MADRLLVAFDDMYGNAYIPRGRNAGKVFGTVLEFIERPSKTPTGGQFISKRFTLRTPDGKKWYGTCSEKKKDSKGRYLVTCRPAS